MTEVVRVPSLLPRVAPFEEGSTLFPAPLPPCSKSRRDTSERMGGTFDQVGHRSGCVSVWQGRPWPWRPGCVPPVGLMGVVPRQVINGLKQRV